MKNRTIYLAPRGFEKELAAELNDVVDMRGRLVIAKGEPQASVWAQNVWLEPVKIPIESIGDGAKKLKSIQRNWWLHTVANHRRAKLIQEKLPYVSAKPVEYGSEPPQGELGAWTLWEKDLIIASPRCSSLFPDGEVRFVEDKETSPTRAYLKLWELFTLLNVKPKAGELCLDMGSCPGGWSWVIAETGARVFSVDRSPLAAHIDAHPHVNFCSGSAFSFDPRHAGNIDWFFSDIICYPERLHDMVTRWMKLGSVKNFVCTIKLQGDTDHEAVKKFAAIPGSRIMHLCSNKHELTWVKLG